MSMSASSGTSRTASLDGFAMTEKPRKLGQDTSPASGSSQSIVYDGEMRHIFKKRRSPARRGRPVGIHAGQLGIGQLASHHSQPQATFTTTWKFAMASRPGDQSERRKIKDVESYRDLLDETAQQWLSTKDRDSLTLFSFVQDVNPLIVSSGLKLVTQLQRPLEAGNLRVVHRFLAEKGEDWKQSLAEALNKGLTEDQWDDFANLDIVEIDPMTDTTSEVEQLSLTATAHSWTESYKGRSHELLWRHISNYYMKSIGSELYANMCAIVQSSGMGKSRAVNELGKTHFLIPMNLRKAGSGYPPADVEIRDYLTQDLKVSDQARGRCFLFLLGLFSQTLTVLRGARETGVVATKQEMTQWFHSRISPPEKNEFRTRFWKGVLDVAKQHGDSLVPKKDAEPLGEGGIVRGATDVPETSGPKGKQKKLPAVIREPNSNMTEDRPATEETAGLSQRPTRAAVAATSKKAKAQELQVALTDGNAVNGIEDNRVGSSIADGEVQRAPIALADGASGSGTKDVLVEGGEVTVEEKGTGGKQTLNARLVASAIALVDFLRGDSPSANQNEVEVVLAFDEAHVLCEKVKFDITSAGQPWSMFYMLREALRCLYGIPIWGLFLSTTGKFSQFNPHHGIDPSMRIRDERFKSVPAFTTLRYDLFAPRIKRTKDGRLWYSEVPNNIQIPPKKKGRTAVKGKVLTLEQATKTEFLVRFGRPLFYLIWHHGDITVRNDIIRFAMNKLICEDPTSLTTTWKSDVPVNAAFACLSQRLCIEFNSSKYNTDEETQIASHMRLCIKIDPDNQFIVSSSGSEPVLAEAAATIMQMDSFKAAESLKHVVSGFGVNKGDRGELVGLLAVTRARDLAVKKRIKDFGLPETPGVLLLGVEQNKPMFRGVTVIEFLSQLFLLENIKKSDKDGLRADFKDAHVYFNHFVRPLDRSTCNLRFLLQYMTRGAAILCSTNMPGIDAAIGILFGSAKGIVFQEDRMSVILMQMKNDRTITERHDRVAIEQGIEHAARRALQDARNPRPIIRITFALGSKEALSYSKSTITLDNEVSVTTHDFWCGGVRDFLPEDNESKSSWKALLSATMKSTDLFEEKDIRFKEIAADRVYLAPGGSDRDSFWGWIEETNDVMEEIEDEGDRCGESHSEVPRARPAKQALKVGSGGVRTAGTKPQAMKPKRKRNPD